MEARRARPWTFERAMVRARRLADDTRLVVGVPKKTIQLARERRAALGAGVHAGVVDRVSSRRTATARLLQPLAWDQRRM
jgi:hypothetical protein